MYNSYVLTLYNSLTRKKENFISLKPKKVRLYVCGITPYDTTHLGHAFTYISFDSLIRTLKFLGYSVTYTQNVTDINDRDTDILKRAKEQNTTWNKLAEFWTNRFLSDMKILGWIIPNNYLKASENIDSIINLILKIVDKKYAYVSQNSVFLDVGKFKDYGKLSRLSLKQMLEKAKEFNEDLTNPYKKNSLDITLWKSSSSNQESHIPSFESPWGKGRPGWHIECSAMAINSLGEQIDIHGGGIDLQYPHHESEIVQSESATGKVPFSKLWVHTATVLIGNQKMSKSLGNLILISDLLKKYSADAIRFVLLSHHYREPWNYVQNEFEKAEGNLKALTRFGKTGENKYLMEKIKLALCDDLNTPAALQIMLDAVVSGNGGGVYEGLELLGFSNYL